MGDLVGVGVCRQRPACRIILLAGFLMFLGGSGWGYLKMGVGQWEWWVRRGRRWLLRQEWQTNVGRDCGRGPSTEPNKQVMNMECNTSRPIIKNGIIIITAAFKAIPKLENPCRNE